MLLLPSLALVLRVLLLPLLLLAPLEMHTISPAPRRGFLNFLKRLTWLSHFTAYTCEESLVCPYLKYLFLRFEECSSSSTEPGDRSTSRHA